MKQINKNSNQSRKHMKISFLFLSRESLLPLSLSPISIKKTKLKCKVKISDNMLRL